MIRRTWLAVGLLVGLLAGGMAFSEGTPMRPTQEQAQAMCTNHANIYHRVAEMRDQGAVQKELLAALDRAAPKLDPAFVEAVRIAIKQVFLHPDLTPDRIAQIVYGSCMRDLTSINI